MALRMPYLRVVGLQEHAGGAHGTPDFTYGPSCMMCWSCQQEPRPQLRLLAGCRSNASRGEVPLLGCRLGQSCSRDPLSVCCLLCTCS